MKIIAVRSYLKRMALTKAYTIAYNTFSDVRLAFFEVELENGIIGYGSGSPAEDVVGETTEQTFANLQTEFVQQFVGRDVRHFQQLIFDSAIQFPHLPGTLAAIDIALHDAFGKLIGCSIAEFYGLKMNGLPTSVTIGIKGVQETLDDAAGYHDLGFTILKIKTGLNLEEDIERITKLRERFGNHFTIRVDANQGYTIDQLKSFINSTKNQGLELIEQPLDVGLENELLQLDMADRVMLAADESLKDPGAALKISHDKPFGIFNIKLMKCGGIMGARDIATIAHTAGTDLFWGCNDESIISITAALHVAYTSVNTKYLDLDGSFDLAEDLVSGGFELKDGCLYINSSPGFGFNLI